MYKVTIKLETDDGGGQLIKVSRDHADYRVALILAMRGLADVEIKAPAHAMRHHPAFEFDQLVRNIQHVAHTYGWMEDSDRG
jgi:hypothetical protein